MNDSFFETLYDKMYESLYKLAVSVLRNPDLAHDIVQETFLIAYKKLDNLKSSPSPNGWLVKTLKNVIGNLLKQQERLARCFITVPLDENMPAPHQPLSLYTQYRGLIDDASLRLLIYVYGKNETYQETADELGISLDTCKKRIQRARQKFKIAFDRENRKFEK